MSVFSMILAAASRSRPCNLTAAACAASSQLAAHDEPPYTALDSMNDARIVHEELEVSAVGG